MSVSDENLNDIKPKMIFSNGEYIPKKIYHQNYYNEHKPQFDEYKKINKDKIQHKRNENKEILKIYNKKYQETNKDILKKKGSNKILCSCGCMVAKWNTSNHCKTKKHIKQMDKIQQQQ